MSSAGARPRRTQPSIDARAARCHFRRAAAGYAAADFLHAEIRSRLLERLDLVNLAAQAALDLGAGPPEATADLARRLPQTRVMALDLVAEMLGTETRDWARLCADAHRLPLADASVDLVTANMLLHWCAEPSLVLAEVRRILRYPGLFLFSTLGPDSLRELRTAWSDVDDFGHTLVFADMHNVGDALLRAGFAEPVVDVERVKVTYRNIRDLVADLRSVGATNAGADRRRALTGRRRWVAMTAAYEKQRDGAGLLPVTVEVIYGQAWAAAGRREASPGVVEVPLDLLRRRR